MAKKDTKKTEPKKSDTLFEKFGEMGSAKELNMCADGFREEGDIESLKAFAVENGFTEEDALNYVKAKETNQTAEFCNPFTAAEAKMRLETKDHPELEKIANLLLSEGDDMELLEAIRKKGKRLVKAYIAMEDEAYKIAKKTASGRNCNGCLFSDNEGLTIIKKYYKEAV